MISRISFLSVLSVLALSESCYGETISKPVIGQKEMVTLNLNTDAKVLRVNLFPTLLESTQVQPLLPFTQLISNDQVNAFTLQFIQMTEKRPTDILPSSLIRYEW